MPAVLSLRHDFSALMVQIKDIHLVAAEHVLTHIRLYLNTFCTQLVISPKYDISLFYVMRKTGKFHIASHKLSQANVSMINVNNSKIIAQHRTARSGVI